jgi:predicted N-acyltransferase
MHVVTVKLLMTKCGDIVIFPTKKLHAQLKDRVNDVTVLKQGVFLNHGSDTSDFLDTLTVSQRRKIARDANSTWSIGIRLYDEQAWCLFGAAY